MIKGLDQHLENRANANVVECEGTCDPKNPCGDCREYYDSLCKCGGEMSSRMVGDEHIMICGDCGRFDGS